MASKELRKGVWSIRWREGGRNRRYRIGPGTEKWAEEIRQEFERRERAPFPTPILPDRKTFGEVAQEWWERFEAQKPSRKHRSNTALNLQVHILPQLGDELVGAITVDRLERWRMERFAQGAGQESVRKSQSIIGRILKIAQRQGLIGQNPVPEMERVNRPRKKLTRPFTPEQIEAIRNEMDLRDQTLVSVLGYEGLRPAEAYNLAWRDIDGRILVDARKTERGRSVRLLPSVRQDLMRWRLASPHPTGQDNLIFPGFNLQRWGKWRSNRWKPALERAGVPYQKPYALRHTAASLLAAEGWKDHDAAKELGHSITEFNERYAHIFAEVGPEERIDAEVWIQKARSARAEEATG